MFLSELTVERYKRFKKVKRAYYSLWVLGVLFLLSLFSELLVNSKPLFIRYNGRNFFPVLAFYKDEDFGGKYKTEAEYEKLMESEAFLSESFVIKTLIPHDPLHPYLSLDSEPPHPPSSKHLLGTDSMARDVLARLIYGFRTCMLFSLMLTFVSTVIGVIIGCIQGYWGGKIDIMIQRFIEIWSSMPFLYVVILVGSIYGRGFVLLLVVMAIFQWIGLSYYMRGEFLKLKNMTYVKSAKAMGYGPLNILFRQILPNALTPVITLVPFMVIGGISSLTALDFLGFGFPPPAPSWGELLQQGLKNLSAPWIALSTVIALFVTLLLTTFIGEGVREAFDPKSEYRIE